MIATDLLWMILTSWMPLSFLYTMEVSTNNLTRKLIPSMMSCRNELGKEWFFGRPKWFEHLPKFMNLIWYFKLFLLKWYGIVVIFRSSSESWKTVMIRQLFFFAWQLLAHGGKNYRYENCLFILSFFLLAISDKLKTLTPFDNSLGKCFTNALRSDATLALGKMPNTAWKHDRLTAMRLNEWTLWPIWNNLLVFCWEIVCQWYDKY